MLSLFDRDEKAVTYISLRNQRRQKAIAVDIAVGFLIVDGKKNLVTKIFFAA